MTIREQKFALCRVAFAVALAVVVAVNALAEEDEFNESDGARLAATEILTLLHVARLYEGEKTKEASELVNAQVSALITMMQKLDETFPHDKDFDQLKGKTALRVKQRWGNKAPDNVDPEIVQYINAACAVSAICRDGAGIKK